MNIRQFPESDWRILRELRTVALERFCERVLRDVQALAADASLTYHQRYGEIYGLIHKRDDELAEAWNGPRRSAAIHQLALMRSYGVITDEEMTRFSVETRTRVTFLAGEDDAA